MTASHRTTGAAPRRLPLPFALAVALATASATARAADIGYGTGKDARNKAIEAFNWFLANAAALGIEEIHDYAFSKYGRGYRCSRADKDGGVIVYKDLASSAGTPGGTWLHVELSPEMADDAAKFEAAWRALPKPGKA
jgi:hypothetical protein